MSDVLMDSSAPGGVGGLGVGDTKTSSLVLEQIHLLAAQLKPHDRDPGMKPQGVH